MLDIPNMILIGGNSRHSGKTTLACKIISKLASVQEIIALKVSSIRPGESDFHGNHSKNDVTSGYTIFEEVNLKSEKDTAKMLRAGAAHVYYIRVEDVFIEQAILHFLSKYINNQIVVCESRSLRDTINPGLFLMMMKLKGEERTKDVSAYLAQADKVLYFDENQTEIIQFAENLNFTNENSF